MSDTTTVSPQPLSHKRQATGTHQVPARPLEPRHFDFERRLSRNSLIAIVGAGGFVFLSLAWRFSPPHLTSTSLIMTGSICLVVFFSERFVIGLPRGGELTASTIALMAGVFILPAPLIGLTAAIGTLGQELLTRRAWYKAVFNTGQMTLSVGLAALLVSEFGGGAALFSHEDAHTGLPVAFAALVIYYVLNTGLISAVIAIERYSSIWSVWLSNNATSLLLDFGMEVIGLLAAYIWASNPVWTVLAAVPAIMACKAYQYIRELEITNEESLVSLADSIDDRDRYTYQHSKRVGEYAEKIAVGMGLTTNQVEIIASAARVHDLGKIGIGNEILHKPGNLTMEERSRMEKHPEIGANILRRYYVHREGLECVLYHHERYDGLGYPTGAKGESIPVGARVVAVADAFEAMTSDRPYRKALPVPVAIREMQRGACTQFDPVVVGVFLKVLAKEGYAIDHPRLVAEDTGKDIENAGLEGLVAQAGGASRFGPAAREQNTV